MKCAKKIKYLYDRISTCRLKEALIIGVYMRCLDNQKEAIEENEKLYGMIAAIKNEEERIGNDVIVIGDFNADLRQNNSNDKLLRITIEENNFEAVEVRNLKTTRLTFRDGVRFSHIDHVLLNTSAMPKLVNVHILDHPSNMSDHKPSVVNLRPRK